MSKVAIELMVLGTLFFSTFHKKMKFHPQVSTNEDTIKYLNCVICHYIRKAKSVKTSKMVQLRGCLKPTINEFEYFFGLKYIQKIII